jgi:hypothetical protein
VAEQNRIGKSTLAKQMQLVFTRSEIYRPEVLRGDFAVNGHCEGGNDEWAFSCLPHREKNLPRPTSNARAQWSEFGVGRWALSVGR